jgi:DNA (cytosine-5)-methyltransferase 1
VLDRLRPAAFVMENVKGMLSSTVESRLVFEMLMEDLASLGTGHGHHYELRAIRLADGKATLQEAGSHPTSSCVPNNSVFRSAATG